ncbi:MAG: glycosyltransferase [Gemmatimonadaceae bacterium]
MRIVAHNGALIWGGAERATVGLLAGLQARGHTVTLLCNNEVVADNCRARGVPASICVLGGDIAFYHAITLAGALRHLRPDAFVVGTYKKLLIATLGARLAHVPRIVARVGLESDVPRSSKYRFALRHWTDAVVVNASRIVRPFAELEGFGASRVFLIHNGVHPARPESGENNIRRDLNIPPGAFVVGTAARIASQKRIDRLLRAVQLVPDATCIVAGDGPARQEIEATVAALDLGGRVHLLGNCDDTADVLRALDVYVVSSDKEGLSNSMLEAMTAGLPIISTDVSGAEDALIRAEFGNPAGIVTDFTSESIATAITRLHSDPALRRSLGEAARTRADRHFSFDGMVEEWEALLQSGEFR